MCGARPLWVCPKCGAKLITPNLWHSCGNFTLESLFAGSTPATLELARQYCAILESLGDVQVLPQKTRLTCVARVRFAGLTPRKDCFVASFALQRRLDSDRVRKVEDYGPRWQIHHVKVSSSLDLDEELRAWLQESHDKVGVQADLH